MKSTPGYLELGFDSEESKEWGVVVVVVVVVGGERGPGGIKADRWADQGLIWPFSSDASLRDRAPKGHTHPAVFGGLPLQS